MRNAPRLLRLHELTRLCVREALVLTGAPYRKTTLFLAETMEQNALADYGRAIFSEDPCIFDFFAGSNFHRVDSDRFDSHACFSSE